MFMQGFATVCAPSMSKLLAVHKRGICIFKLYYLPGSISSVWEFSPHSRDSQLMKRLAQIRDKIRGCFNNLNDTIMGLSARTINGKLVSAKIYDLLRTKGNPRTPMSFIWKSYIPPKFSFNVWLALRNRLPTQDSLGYLNMVNRCDLCKSGLETIPHLFFLCPFTCRVWDKIREWMGLGHEMTTLLSSIKWITKTHKGSTLKAKAARLAFCASVYYIWHTRNENLFDDGTKTEDNVIAKVKHMLIGVFGALVSFMDRDGSFQDAFNDSWKQMISRHPVCFYYSTGTIVVFLLAGIIGFAYYLWAIDTEKREEFRIACLGWIILECVLTSSKTFIPLALALISAFTIFGVAYGFFLGTLAFHKSWQKHRDVLSKRCLTEEYVVEDLHGYYFAPPKLDPEHEERLRALKLM